LAADAADQMATAFAARWGLARRVTDVINILPAPAPPLSHRLIRRLAESELDCWRLASDDLLPERRVVEPAASAGRMYVAIEDGVIVGHGSSFAAGSRFADVGVHVSPPHRGQGLATCAAAQACGAVQVAGLTPVWGTSSDNTASLRVAAKLGFVEADRLVYLVREAGRD
jgi:GNAT superfamily N-acetyltransferase